MMSRMLRDIPPQFIWSLRKDQVDFRFLRKEQMVNHHSKTGTFTTKLGLCTSLRQLPWYDNEDSDFFYPRAYLITTDEDRQAFVEDFRITACANILKLLIQQYDDMEAARLQQEQEALEQETDKTRAASAAKSRAASAKSTRSRSTFAIIHLRFEFPGKSFFRNFCGICEKFPFSCEFMLYTVCA